MLYDWFKHISFAYPYVWGLLVIIPVLIFWYRKNNMARQGSMIVTTTHFISEVRSNRTWLKHFPFVLRCLAIGCLIVALARPQHKFTEQQTQGEGIDIVLCFDISGSMTEKDFLPNRLQASKDVALDFVNGRAGDRIGVVIFSRQSFTLCPLTTDKNTVLSQISRIQSGYLTEDGTAIGSGLATSVDRLKNSKTKSRIIILLTDGVDFGGTIPPDIAKEMAKLYKIKVYTIGVGSEKEIDEQVETPFGKMNNKKRLEFNEDLLKDLAVETGGQYFHALDREGLEKIYSSINQLEKSTIEITSYNRFTEEFLPWLLAAFGLLLLEIVLRYTVFKKFP
ncbi:MAG: VWA domain-containing protein [Chitinophagaceae bacterium]|nr:VWA domain-containing protein [Chitinophagaceae bacterium]